MKLKLISTTKTTKRYILIYKRTNHLLKAQFQIQKAICHKESLKRWMNIYSLKFSITKTLLKNMRRQYVKCVKQNLDKSKSSNQIPCSYLEFLKCMKRHQIIQDPPLYLPQEKKRKARQMLCKLLNKKKQICLTILNLKRPTIDNIML